MNRLVALTAAFALLAGPTDARSPSQQPRALEKTALTYPHAPRSSQADLYHGKLVADPYRWLEDTESPETRRWIEAQNALTRQVLDGIPRRDALKKRMTELWNFERYGVPFREGNRTFFFKNDGLQNQSVLYTMRNLDETPKVLIDPNAFSKDGTVALGGTSVSPDGRYIAYSISTSGSDWREWKVRDIDTGKDLSDHLKWAKFSGASWTRDGKGFFYSRYDAPKGNDLKEANYYQKLYYHRLGTPQSEDTLVYERPDQKEWGFYGAVSEDGRYLILTISQGTDPNNRLYVKDLSDPKSPVVPLLDKADASYSVIGNDGPIFWLLTTQSAPRGRVIALDLRKPESWKEVIPQSAENLEDVSLLGDYFVATTLKDAQSVVNVYRMDGRFVREVKLPGIGSAWGFGGKRRDAETFYAFTSFTSPIAIYRYDLATGQSTLFRKPQVDVDPSRFETQQVFYTSKDGTRVPMFITHRKGLKLDGKNPTYLYGYGGFNVSLTPTFSVSNLVWMEQGGVYAMPNLRGGGEYGQDWHQAGTKLSKQNVFDDFIAAAEWLIANGYTSSEKLAIGGGSNGGLLVGACMTQRPELFKAAVPEVGVLDMLRYQHFTIGWAWASDYGLSSDPAEFKALLAYSPVHNVKPGTRYPATLVMTADHDDRVFPAHSFKFAAALQHAHAHGGHRTPALIRIETRAGHGAGKPTAKIIEEASDRWGFLLHHLSD
ncbi:Prolyl endopeptidase precursor [compost metagenome]